MTAISASHAGSEEQGRTLARWARARLRQALGGTPAHRPDVAHNAVAAGTRDPRALPIRLDDVDRLDLELSLLSPLEEVAVGSEEEALAALADRRHGVVIAWRNRRATFLPVMWETFTEPEALLHALKRKAGLAGDFWHDEVRLWRYTVEVFVDPAPGELP